MAFNMPFSFFARQRLTQLFHETRHYRVLVRIRACHPEYVSLPVCEELSRTAAPLQSSSLVVHRFQRRL